MTKLIVFFTTMFLLLGCAMPLEERPHQTEQTELFTTGIALGALCGLRSADAANGEDFRSGVTKCVEQLLQDKPALSEILRRGTIF